MTIKYCKDCIYHNTIWDRCTRDDEEIKTESLVNGNIDTVYSIREISCKFDREYGWVTSRLVGACGKEGRYFEPKN